MSREHKLTGTMAIESLRNRKISSLLPEAILEGFWFHPIEVLLSSGLDINLRRHQRVQASPGHAKELPDLGVVAIIPSSLFFSHFHLRVDRFIEK